MFYVAYTKDGVADMKARPVTFLYNGGPGSSSIWLHMGSVGPMRVVTSDARPIPPAPFGLVENQNSLLDRSDLVFIDAPGTGFSRIVGKGEPKDFYGTDPDVKAFGQFIERYISDNGRWNSPKFLFGESYGTTRSAALVDFLQNKGMAFNGVVLVSSYLNAYDDFNGPSNSNDLPYSSTFPQWPRRRGRMASSIPNPKTSKPFSARSDSSLWATTRGHFRRAAGSRTPTGAASRRGCTNSPDSLNPMSSKRTSGFGPIGSKRSSSRSDRRTLGRLDARFLGIDRDAAGESPEYDPANDAISAAFTGSFHAWIEGALNFRTDAEYKTTNYREVGKDWDDHHFVEGEKWPLPDVAENLRQAMTKNPRLLVFSANGYFDLRRRSSRRNTRSRTWASILRSRKTFPSATMSPAT